jgi:hypothetical protein
MVLFENKGITYRIRKGFIVYLIAHNKTRKDLLNPKFKGITQILNSEFVGMTHDPIEIREKLVNKVVSSLIKRDRRFLLSVKQGRPQWAFFDVQGGEWKLVNLAKISLPITKDEWISGRRFWHYEV